MGITQSIVLYCIDDKDWLYNLLVYYNSKSVKQQSLLPNWAAQIDNVNQQITNYEHGYAHNVTTFQLSK